MLKKILRFTQRKIVNSLIYWEIICHGRKASVEKRMLLMKPEGIGDFLLFYPTLKYYLAKFSDYKIYFLASDRSLETVEDINNNLHLFSNVLVFDKKRFASNFFYRRKTCLDIYKYNFDLIVYPTSWREPKCDEIIRCAGAAKKIVFSGSGFYLDWEVSSANAIYEEIIQLPENLFTEIDKYKFFAKTICEVEVDYSKPGIDIFKDNRLSAVDILNEFNLSEKKFVVIFPGAANFYRVWPLDRFAEIIRLLLKKNIVPVVAGSKADNYLLLKIFDFLSVEEKYKIVNLCGRTSILTLGAILEKSLFYFGSETGALHLAAAVNCPTICLLGGGHFGRFFPYGDQHLNRVVYDLNMRCRNDDWACAQGDETRPAPCIEGIKLGDAVKEIEALLKELA
jgi:ADP-heptose:LPS heptosyltransferase